MILECEGSALALPGFFAFLPSHAPHKPNGSEHNQPPFMGLGAGVKWERKFCWVVSIVPLVGLDFQGMGVFRSDEWFKRFLGVQRERMILALHLIVSMSPPSYPSARVASLQSPLPFHLAK